MCVALFKARRMLKFFKNTYHARGITNALLYDNTSKFECMIDERRLQALNSILIIIPNINSTYKVIEQCSKYGKIKKAFSYIIKNGKAYLLLEFSNAKIVDCLTQEAKHFDPRNVIPVRSRLLWYSDFRSKIDTIGKKLSNKQPFLNENEIHLDLDMDIIKNELSNNKTVTQQMLLLHEGTRVSELGKRLRFFLCSLIDDSLAGMFPNCRTIPFGSSINGLGKHDSDLDMLLTLDHKLKEVPRPPPKSCFLFDSKRILPSDRLQTQRHLEALATIMQQFLPGCCEINRILRARVPIVRFHHDKIGLSCDLSIGSNGGLEMAELLYNYSQRDPRFRPLFFTLRHWAKHWGITHPYPGKWITNFMLAIMSVFYLTNISKISATTSSHDLPNSPEWLGLEECLVGFFTFYQKFDYKNMGLGIVSQNGPRGSSPTTFPKPDYSPLFIQNPIDETLNIAKNVTQDQIDRLVQVCRSSLWQLENGGQVHSSKQILPSLTNLLFDCDVEEGLNLHFSSPDNNLSPTPEDQVKKSIDVRQFLADSPSS